MPGPLNRDDAIKLAAGAGVSTKIALLWFEHNSSDPRWQQVHDGLYNLASLAEQIVGVPDGTFSGGGSDKPPPGGGH